MQVVDQKEYRSKGKIVLPTVRNNDNLDELDRLSKLIEDSYANLQSENPLKLQRSLSLMLDEFEKGLKNKIDQH